MIQNMNTDIKFSQSAKKSEKTIFKA